MTPLLSDFPPSWAIEAASMTFKEQLIITVVDKAAIGALLLIGGFWLNRVLERFKSELAAARDREQRVSEAQFKLYSEVWSKLQDLKSAGDRLWERCAPETLTAFVAALPDARLAVDRGRLILREADHERLQEILGAFGQFLIGKTRLSEILSNQDLERNLQDDTIARINQRLQIQQNLEHKNAYEGLLGEILPEFRRQLGVAASRRDD
jgi:hypothetical protein